MLPPQIRGVSRMHVSSVVSYTFIPLTRTGWSPRCSSLLHRSQKASWCSASSSEWPPSVTSCSTPLSAAILPSSACMMGLATLTTSLRIAAVSLGHIRRSTRVTMTHRS